MVCRVQLYLRKASVSLATMKTKSGTLLLLLLALWVASVVGREGTWNGRIVMPTQDKNDNEPEKGTRWAILIAGSAGYWNYRHQVLFISFVKLYYT